MSRATPRPNAVNTVAWTRPIGVRPAVAPRPWPPLVCFCGAPREACRATCGRSPCARGKVTPRDPWTAALPVVRAQGQVRS